METVDAAHMRATNSSILLKLIWKNREISRADISRLTGMSRSTVSAIVADLMRRGLVSESGIGHSNGGRRPVILSFNEKAYTILGIELGVAAIHAVALNLNGHVQIKFRKDCDVVHDPESALRLIEEIIKEVQSHCEKAAQPLIGIGIGVPAPLLATDAGPFLWSIFPAWQGYSVAEYLETRVSVPVKFQNDANLGALAEHWWGVGNSSENLICIKVGHSIGAGLIINGKIHQGARGLAGELGSMNISSLPDEKRLTVNALIGGKGVLERLTQALQEEEHSSSLPLDDSLNLTAILEAAELGDELALKVLDHAAATLGVVVSNVLAVLDAEKVVISGACKASLRERLIGIVRRTVQEQETFSNVEKVAIVESALGDMQVAIGAGTLILDCALNDLRLFQPLHRQALPEHQWTEESAFEGSPN